MSKYAPLRDFLRSSRGRAIRVGFAELEGILGFRLPDSAYRYPAWWSNNPKGHSHSLAWVDAGWESEQVDVEGRQVTFRRRAGEATAPPSTLAVGQITSPFGALRGTVRFARDFDPTEPTGEKWDAEHGRF